MTRRPGAAGVPRGGAGQAGRSSAVRNREPSASPRAAGLAGGAGDATAVPRRGIALPAAIFALAVVALFIAGSAFATQQEARAALGSLVQRIALEAAEYGAASVLRDWHGSWNLGLPQGGTVTVAHALAGGATSQVRLTRTGTSTFWAVSTGMAGGPDPRRAARRTVNAVLRLDLPVQSVDAALSATDSVRILGSGMVIGSDSLEALAACGPSASPVAGVASPDTMRTCSGACGSPGGRVAGVPALLADTSVAGRVAAAFRITPDIVLPGGAVVTPGPVVIAGACDTTATLNWGDPAGGPCATRLPVIRVRGDVTVRGGTGQGILIADGDIQVEAGARLAGLVVAGDDVITGTGGGTVLGAVLAGDRRRGSHDHTRIGDEGVIRRSSCRLRQAWLAAARPVRVRERWWAEFD